MPACSLNSRSCSCGDTSRNARGRRLEVIGSGAPRAPRRAELGPAQDSQRGAGSGPRPPCPAARPHPCPRSPDMPEGHTLTERSSPRGPAPRRRHQQPAGLPAHAEQAGAVDASSPALDRCLPSSGHVRRSRSVRGRRARRRAVLIDWTGPARPPSAPGLRSLRGARTRASGETGQRGPGVPTIWWPVALASAPHGRWAGPTRVRSSVDPKRRPHASPRRRRSPRPGLRDG